MIKKDTVPIGSKIGLIGFPLNEELPILHDGVVSSTRVEEGGFFWYTGLKLPDNLKEIGNFIYNDLIKGGKDITTNNIYKWLDENKEPLENMFGDEISLLILPFIIVFIKVCEKMDKLRETLENGLYIEQIKKEFLPELVENGFKNKITDVLFGHTHDPLAPELHTDISINNEFWDVRIANCGAWQQVSRPSFIKINEKGECELTEFEL